MANQGLETVEADSWIARSADSLQASERAQHLWEGSQPVLGVKHGESPFRAIIFWVLLREGMEYRQIVCHRLAQYR